MKNDKDVPKVLVGAPVYSNKKYVIPYWIESVKGLNYPNYDTLVVDNSAQSDRFENLFLSSGIDVLRSEPFDNPFKRLGEARRKLNEYAVGMGYDYLMSIEQDVIVPPEILDKLVSHELPIVAAPYIVSSHTDKDRRHIDFIVSASNLDKILGQIDGIDINEWYLAKEIQNKGLMRVKSCSLGCTLISTPILKRIRVRYNPKIKRADDSYFFHDCYNQGIPVFIDTDFLWKIDHIKRLGGEVLVGQSIDRLQER